MGTTNGKEVCSEECGGIKWEEYDGQMEFVGRSGINSDRCLEGYCVKKSITFFALDVASTSVGTNTD